MAVFQVSKKNKNNKSEKNAKKIAGFSLLAVATICFLFSVTSIWPAFHYFLKGVFGVFIYPLSILLMIVAIALLNNKRYVMTKRYAVFLSLSVIFLLAIIQLIIVGGGKDLSFGKYLALNYTKQNTAGGIIIGFLTTCFVKLVRLPASYVIFSLLLIVSVAFFVEALLSERKNAVQSSPVRIQIKEKPVIEKSKVLKDNRVKKSDRKEKQAREDINVVLNGNIQENLSREQNAKQKLGLVGAAMPQKNEEFKVQEKPQERIPNGMSLKEYLLSPPKVDLEAFRERRNSAVQTAAARPSEPMVNRKEMDKTINEIKSEPIKPSQFVFEQQYDTYTEPVKRGNLPEIKPEEIVSEADDIIKSVVESELRQMELEENIKPAQVQESDTRNIEKVNFDETDAFDFSDIEEPKQEPKPFERSFDRGINQSFDRNQSFSREDSSSSERSPFRRDYVQNIDRMQNSEQNEQPRADLTRDRSRRFVSLDEEETKKPTFKPYKYNKPSIELIKTMSDDPSMLSNEVPEKRVALENALEKFGVPAKVQSVVVGPTVTRYEIAMPEGVSVKKVLTLDADIAYALSAKGEIRIEAPIPGRSIVGIEVPNEKVLKVSIKDVLQSKEFTMSPSPLAFALGKDITGAVRICNLQKMPHLLVAGTTGSGKSVCLNSIIISLLYRASPDDVKFIMIDPKLVELSMYEGLPHMVIPKVITDPTKAVNALQWAVDEMERRFNLLSEERVRDIGEYNKTDNVTSGRKKKMPYLVIIFDEFADFMAVAKNEIEDKIRRLAQKARAAGIHLILATQRPSTDVVTGTIKANFPARIAFKVAGRVDSEVIMGATGAEKLLGYGDMLYKPSDSAPARIQGCFIDTPETKDIVNYIIQNNEETYDEDAVNAISGMNKNGAGAGDGDKNGMDPLLPQALKICIDVGVASTTMVQRKLSIGYPRAARIIDQMEQMGYISTAEGSKQRTVYTTIEEYYEIFGDDYD